MAAPASSRILAAEGAPRGGLVSLCITQTTAWGVLYYALPTAVQPISADTGWDPALITGAFSLGLLVSAVAGIAVGRTLDRTGPRTLMIAGSLTGTLALILVALSPSLPLFAAAWLLAGTAQAAILYQPAFTIISRWYGQARVRPLTTLTLVAGFASTIFAPLTSTLSTAVGWRPAFVILALLMALITVPLHARYLNRTWSKAAPGEKSEADPKEAVRKIRRSPEFLRLQALMVLLCLGLYTVTLNIIPLLTEKGSDYATAALAFGLVGAGQVGGRLLFATIPINTRLPAVAGSAFSALFLLAAVPGPLPVLIAAGVLRSCPWLPDPPAGNRRGGQVGKPEPRRSSGPLRRAADCCHCGRAGRRPTAGLLAGLIHRDGLRHGCCLRGGSVHSYRGKYPQAAPPSFQKFLMSGRLSPGR